MLRSVNGDGGPTKLPAVKYSFICGFSLVLGSMLCLACLLAEMSQKLVKILIFVVLGPVNNGLVLSPLFLYRVCGGLLRLRCSTPLQVGA